MIISKENFKSYNNQKQNKILLIIECAHYLNCNLSYYFENIDNFEKCNNQLHNIKKLDDCSKFTNLKNSKCCYINYI